MGPKQGIVERGSGVDIAVLSSADGPPATTVDF
jgi:hypothetical protein